MVRSQTIWDEGPHFGRWLAAKPWAKVNVVGGWDWPLQSSHPPLPTSAVYIGVACGGRPAEAGDPAVPRLLAATLSLCRRPLPPGLCSGSSNGKQS